MKGSILMPKIKEKISLDKKNQQLLQMLINNSRTSITNIAKKLRLSKPAVLHRLRQLEQKEVILDYILYTNLKPAGFQFYLVLFEVDKEKEEITIEELLKNKFTSALFQLGGKFNLLWMCWCRDSKHFQEIFPSFNIKDLRILPGITNFFDSYHLFEELHNLKLSPEKLIEHHLDKIDTIILEELKNDSRKSLVDLSSKCRITAEAIKHRIKKLESAGVILSYFTNFNIFKLGFQPYCILIKSNRSEQEKILQFLRAHPHTNGQYLLSHEFDLCCFVVVEDISQLRQFLNQLSSFSSVIEFETHLCTDQLCSDSFPKGVKEYKQ
ncbi:MAG: Lrp/AsnC family transcriptional regulator [Candidatus Woesearchaeota archaeon]|jgi:DNA-binding Lrp family transcriptional regulator